MIRASTLTRLLDFHTGPLHLGAALGDSLRADAVETVLLDSHLAAVDRRVGVVLQVVRECLRRNPDAHSEVIFTHDDLYASSANSEAVDDKQWS